jgi:hypothetical protein
MIIVIYMIRKKHKIKQDLRNIKYIKVMTQIY